jgi:hypothetical protein
LCKRQNDWIMGKVKYNRLGTLFYKQPGSVQKKVREDLALYKLKWGRFRYWFTVPDENLIEMPTSLKTVACKNIPQAEKHFKLPNPEALTLFDS